MTVASGAAMDFPPGATTGAGKSGSILTWPGNELFCPEEVGITSLVASERTLACETCPKGQAPER